MNFQPSQKPFLLCVMVLVILGLLSFVPQFPVGEFHFKKIDLFANVRPDPPPLETFPEKEVLRARTPVTGSVNRDSVSADKPVAPADACPPGITCIEDYSDDGRGITAFAEALSKLKATGSGKVRIAFYGDSFIEGDIFCGSVRDTLQTLFGGRGVGFVPITSHVVGFRNTVRQNFDHWKTYSIIKKDTTRQVIIGPAGYCFKPTLDNWVEFRSSRQRYLRQFESMRIYYRSLGESYVHYTLNDTLYRVAALQKGKRLREWKRENIKARKVEFTFENPDSIEVYGASFEGRHGVYVDNFAMRGNSGIGLHLIPTYMLRNFNKYRDYKLIILQYGLNALNFDSSRYAWYSDRMVTVIERLKEVFPNASIVLLSVSDRSANVNGTYRTISTIPMLRNTQRQIAQRTRIAFWDLYEAMGGENSMVKFVSAKPALAARDYTHLTFKGGKRLAGELVGSLLYEFEKYEKKNQLP